MIYQAKESDLKNLSRRGFLRLFGTTAATAVVAPTKTFVFFGDILRPKAPPIMQAIPKLEGIIKPEWFIVAGIAAVGLLLSPELLLGAGKK